MCATTSENPVLFAVTGFPTLSTVQPFVDPIGKHIDNIDTVVPCTFPPPPLAPLVPFVPLVPVGPLGGSSSVTVISTAPYSNEYTAPAYERRTKRASVMCGGSCGFQSRRVSLARSPP